MAKVLTEETVFARILGMFSIRFQNHRDYFMLMENVSADRSLKFDLKGSQVNREVGRWPFFEFTQMPVQTVYKDMDFVKNIGSIRLRRIHRVRLLGSLRTDTQILEKFNIMDYSLLVSIQDPWDESDVCKKYRIRGVINGREETLTLGLIDYLQVYSLTKKMERVLKVITHPKVSHRLSVVSPTAYRRRFILRMEEFFVS